jgi:uncharacterized protein (TIGR00159 family)
VEFKNMALGDYEFLSSSLKNFLHLFRWQDGLDILIQSYIFYRLYLWLRKKKALRMVIAILALPIFYFIGKWIDLPLSVWMLQNMWPMIIIILVVIFQDEIREVLGNINLPSFFFGRPDRLSSKTIDRIVDATFQMINKKIGGLIVFQKGDNLDEIIHQKKLLDAEIDEELLISIFNQQSPLHDGAVIIKGDRIRYAAALLPLSKSTQLPKEWGTRHRAGVGITEASDGKCIIISEERGEVLLASGGKVKRIEKKEELKEGLSDISQTEDNKNKDWVWGKKIFKDIPRKILFLILVCVIWIFLIAVPQSEINYTAPIEYYSIPQNLEISGDPPKEVNVILKGSQRILSTLKPNQIRILVNLSNARRGINQISLTEANINTFPGITVKSFYPHAIKINLLDVSDLKKKM